MTAMTIVDMLRCVDFFSALPDDPTDCVAALKQGRIDDFLPGDPIALRGEPGQCISIVFGAVEQGHRVLRSGATLDVVPLVLDRRRADAVVAVEPCRVFRLERSAFLQVIQACPAMSWTLIQHLATRIADADRVGRLEDRTPQSTEQPS